MGIKILDKKLEDKFEANDVLAEIKDLKLSLITGKKQKLVINEVSLQIREGEILGIIGESGSGKTILTSAFTGLNLDIQNILEGEVFLGKNNITRWTFENWEESKLRGSFISQVFQNPLSSLNPYKKIKAQLIESIIINAKTKITKKEAYLEAIKLLEQVKINNPLEVLEMYPHQLSGGMNQRIVIVSILAAKPKIIIFDEPTTALDPVVQAQIIEIIREINQKLNTSIIFISHDIALVAKIADSIAIMYAGRVIEKGLTEEIINYPLHPYTWGLLMSIPNGASQASLYTIPGVVPQNISNIEGDMFAPRSEYALEIDFKLKPPKIIASKTHYVYSWLYDTKAPFFQPPKVIEDKWRAWIRK